MSPGRTLGIQEMLNKYPLLGFALLSMCRTGVQRRGSLSAPDDREVPAGGDVQHYQMDGQRPMAATSYHTAGER